MAPLTRSTIGPTRARQGRTGRHVLWVLVFGIALTVLAFVAAYLWKAPDLRSAAANNPTASSTPAPAFNAPEPAPISAPSTPGTSDLAR